MMILSPIGKPLANNVMPSERPRRLDGLRIGLLDNTKAPVDVMMTHLTARLAERLPGCTVFSISKQHPLSPAEPEVLRSLRAHADVVIDALGD